MGSPNEDDQASLSILLAQGADMQSGLLVDKVIDVLDVVKSSIQPPLTTLPENMRHVVLGLIEHQSVLIAILDLNRIFDDYSRGLT